MGAVIGRTVSAAYRATWPVRWHRLLEALLLICAGSPLITPATDGPAALSPSPNSSTSNIGIYHSQHTY